MARYTSSFIAGMPVKTARQNLADILRSCGLDVIYESEEYVMAREKPGNVSFAKLVTVEALIDATTASENKVQIKIVVKNEELPLHVNNHCQQLFSSVQSAIAASQYWEITENAVN